MRTFKTFLNESFVDKFYTVYQNITKILSDELVANKKVSDAIPIIEKKFSQEFSKFEKKISVNFIENKKNNIGVTGVFFSEKNSIDIYVPMFVDPIWRKDFLHTKIISTAIHEFIHTRQEISKEYFEKSYIKWGKPGLKHAKYMLQDLEFQPWIQGTILNFVDVEENNFDAFMDHLVTDVPKIMFPFLGPGSERGDAIKSYITHAISQFHLPDNMAIRGAVGNLVDAFNATFQIGKEDLRSRAISWVRVIKKEFKLFQMYRRRFG